MFGKVGQKDQKACNLPSRSGGIPDQNAGERSNRVMDRSRREAPKAPLFQRGNQAPIVRHIEMLDKQHRESTAVCWGLNRFINTNGESTDPDAGISDPVRNVKLGCGALIFVFNIANKREIWCEQFVGRSPTVGARCRMITSAVTFSSCTLFLLPSPPP